MSQRPPASRPASRSPPDGQRITLPPVQHRDDVQPGGRQAERQQTESEARASFSQQPQPASQHARAPPPLVPPGDEWRTAPSRDLGVHSMLNPTEPESSTSSGRRPSTTESPLSAIGPPPTFGTSPSTITAHPFPGPQTHSSTPPSIEGYPANYPRPRRILTPRSPSRALSAGRGFGPATATIDAQQSPFLGSRGRAYIAEPGPSASSEVPPMPTPPGRAQMQQYGFPAPASTPSIAPKRPSVQTMQAPGRTPLSQSASPSISASSHNPSSSQTSPASFLYNKGGPPPPSSSGYFPGSSFATSMQQGGGIQFPGPAGGSEGLYSAPDTQTQGSSFHSSSAGSSRQTSASDSTQFLTITTSQGSYHVPVDVHQASKLADEKRARNAGASARFRQRRKEKEKEASSNIEKLQQQTRELERKVREVEQERDFYRGERDRFRDVVFRAPELRHLAIQAPPSPQSTRASSFQGSMTSMGGPPPSIAGPPPPMGMGMGMGFPAPESGSGPGPERAPRRRRTDARGDYSTSSSSNAPYSLPPSSTLPPVPPPGYSTGQGPPPLAGYSPVHGPAPPPPPPQLPPLRMENPNVTTPVSTSGAPPSTNAGTPYEYPRGPYERGWVGEGSRR